jgi:hypothetical protein
MWFANLFKERCISSVLAFLVIACLGLPSLTAWTHAFSDHQDQKCTDSTTLHIHKVEGDCAFLKFKPAPQFYFTITGPRIFYPALAKSPIRTTYRFVPTIKSIHFLLRGPPDQLLS